MSSLHFAERNLLEKILGMKNGYVSDFSDRTFREFVLDATGIDIMTEKYEKNGTSKANRLRTFWEEESNELNAGLIELLLKYAYSEKTDYDRELSARDGNLFIEARKIVQRLIDEPGNTSKDAFTRFASNKKTTSLGHENIKQSLTAFLSDLSFPQKKRKTETIKSHFPMLDEFELKQLLSQVGAVRYESAGSELWAIPPVPNHTTPVQHITGDYIFGDKISGDKVGRDKNISEPTGDIPLWFKWVVGIATTLAFVWGIYIYFNPNLQTVSTVPISTLDLNKNRFATTTPNLVDIFSKTNSMLDLDKENFLKDYENGPVYAVGAAFENINSSGEGFIVRMTVERNMIGCAFGPEFRKELLLLKKRDKVDFYGIFTGSGLGGYGDINPWYITDCFLLK